MNGTRQRILDTARALFNERGVHRVAVRDLARALGLSPGNLAYHFRTKDDLVSALAMELHELDARTIFAGLPERISLADLYASAVAAMRNMLSYRFVLLDFTDAVRASPPLQKLAIELRGRRFRRHLALVDALVRSGSLDRRRIAPRTEIIFEQGELIASGWLAAAVLRGWHDDEAAVLHFAKVGLALLEPHCTPRGVRELRRILAGACDAPSKSRKSTPAKPARRSPRREP